MITNENCVFSNTFLNKDEPESISFRLTVKRLKLSISCLKKKNNAPANATKGTVDANTITIEKIVKWKA